MKGKSLEQGDIDSGISIHVEAGFNILECSMIVQWQVCAASTEIIPPVRSILTELQLLFVFVFASFSDEVTREGIIDPCFRSCPAKTSSMSL